MGVENYVFSSRIEDDLPVITIQHKEKFIEDLHDLDDEMVDDVGDVIAEGGFLALDDDGGHLCHEEKSEIEVIRYLKESGLTYSVELEEVIADKSASKEA